LVTAWTSCNTECTSTVSLSVFGTDCYPHVLITSGKGGICAIEWGGGGGDYVFVNVDVLDKLVMGMRTVAVASHWGVNESSDSFYQEMALRQVL
jgi:hypothetical protein